MTGQDALLITVVIAALFLCVGVFFALRLSSLHSRNEDAEREAHPSISAARNLLGGRRDE